eukprot:444291-Pyramimonas_sp.AAC.1
MALGARLRSQESNHGGGYVVAYLRAETHLSTSFLRRHEHCMASSVDARWETDRSYQWLNIGLDRTHPPLKICKGLQSVSASALTWGDVDAVSETEEEAVVGKILEIVLRETAKGQQRVQAHNHGEHLLICIGGRSLLIPLVARDFYSGLNSGLGLRD